MNYYDSTDDSFRKLTDDFRRHHLTDVLEEDDPASDRHCRPSSTSPHRGRYSPLGSSLDRLWETHPHRLSEAGLSRHSDASVILTEDTDSFIIGERVWVGGNKPGVIAFIGETQFAPGEWAGIALDEPIGKNDGSVAGIKYFQCEPKKGVFSRLTRLTRVPLDQPYGGSSDFSCSTPLPTNGIRKSSVSPTSSIRSLQKSPVSLSTSNTSLTSAASHSIDFRIGDRVIIKSSQGSKVGIVRYIGLTDFAPGEWIGVELDDPRGKNDGTVEGKRYFECRPNFGLFAPIAKVSKSPLKYKPGSCQIHSGGPGLPPTGMRRANSKESMTSMTSMTSATSSVRRVRLGVTSLTPKKAPLRTSMTPRPSMQDLLKEKQQQIEQLLKERDLERAEITKAASQADEAEQKLASLKLEFDQYRAECEVKLKENLILLEELKKDRNEIISQLEDERRKNEDLLFKFEEAAIIKSDLEMKLKEQTTAAQVSQDTIKALEDSLAAERNKIETLESDANKLFETEENLIKAREEMDILKKALEEQQNNASVVSSEKTAASEQLDLLKKQLEETRKQLEETRKQLEETATLHSETSEEVSQLKLELEKAQNAIVSKDSEIGSSRATNQQLEEKLAQLTNDIERISKEKHETETTLSKEIEKIKMELSAKTFDVETVTENLRSKETEINSLEQQMDTLKAELENKMLAITNLEASSKTAEDNLKTSLENTIKELNSTKEELAKEKLEHERKHLEKDNKIDEVTKQRNFLEQALEEYKTKVSDLQKSMEATAGELHEKLNRELESKASEIKNLSEQLQKKNDEIDQRLAVHKKLEESAKSNEEVLQRTLLELNSVKRQNDTYNQEITKLNEQLNNLVISEGDLKRQLETSTERVAELTEQRKTLEEEVQSMIRSSGDYGTKLEEMNNNLKQKQEMLEQAKEELSLKVRELEILRQEAEFKCRKDEEAMAKTKADYQDALMAASIAHNSVKDHYESQIKELSETRDRLEKEITGLQKANEEKEVALGESVAKCAATEKELNKKMEHLSEYMKETVDGYQRKIKEALGGSEAMVSALKDEFATSKETLEKEKAELEEKLRALVQNEESLNHQLQAATSEVAQTKEEYQKQLEQLKKSLDDKQSELTSLETQLGDQLTTLMNDLNKNKDELRNALEALEQTKVESQNTVATLTNQLADKDLRIQELDVKLVGREKELSESSRLFKVEIQTLESFYIEKDKEIEELKGKLGQTELEMEALKREIASKEQNYTNLHQDIEGAQNQKLALETEIENLKKMNENLSNEHTHALESNIDLVTELDFVKNRLEEAQALIKIQQKDEQTAGNTIREKDEEIASLEGAVNDLKSSSEDLLDVQNNVLNILKTVQFTEEQKSHLVGQILANCDKSSHYKSILQVLQKMPVGVDPNLTKIQQLKTALETTKKALGEKQTNLESQKAEIFVLQQQLLKAQNSPSKVLGNDNNVSNVPSANNNNHDYKQLLEDKLQAESQVQFLNSIIVDMQRKNEEQKMRIEILESGFSPAAAQELNLLGYKMEKNVAPRMYCDICEEFDLHETEECPQQTSDDLMPPPPPPVSKGTSEVKKKEKPPPRPYCDICEVFGHATEECQEDDTY